MKLPRDLSGPDLQRALAAFGYSVTRQEGSHVRLTTQKNGEHHVTIPKHSQLRVGTVSSILDAVADHLRLSRDELIWQLFGRR